MVDKRHPVPIRSRRIVTTRRRPNRAWTGASLSSFVAIGSSSKVLLATFTLSNANIDETILRVVGSIGVRSDQSAASEDQVGALGFIVVNDLAVAAGAASIPGPITDAADDGWFVYVPIMQSLTFVSAVGIRPDMTHRYDFDSKAKRRVQEGSQIAVMVENADAADGFAISFVFRMLSMVSGTG